jgi:hypothetical protein
LKLVVAASIPPTVEGDVVEDKSGLGVAYWALRRIQFAAVVWGIEQHDRSVRREGDGKRRPLTGMLESEVEKQTIAS